MHGVHFDAEAQGWHHYVYAYWEEEIVDFGLRCASSGHFGTYKEQY